MARLVGGFTEVPGRPGPRRGRTTAPAARWSLPGDACPDGPATLLLRREQLRVSPRGEASTGDWRLPGTVAGVRRRGPRLSVLVDPASDGPRIEVELDLGDPAPPDPGTGVDVVLAAGATPWAVVG